jgi:hypothetical protein
MIIVTKLSAGSVTSREPADGVSMVASELSCAFVTMSRYNISLKYRGNPGKYDKKSRGNRGFWCIKYRGNRERFLLSLDYL